MGFMPGASARPGNAHRFRGRAARGGRRPRLPGVSSQRQTRRLRSAAATVLAALAGLALSFPNRRAPAVARRDRCPRGPQAPTRPRVYPAEDPPAAHGPRLAPVRAARPRRISGRTATATRYSCRRTSASQPNGCAQELGVSAEQEQRLRAVADATESDLIALAGRVTSGEKAAGFATDGLRRDCRRRAEQTLRPAQLEALKTLSLSVMASRMLSRSRRS